MTTATDPCSQHTRESRRGGQIQTTSSQLIQANGLPNSRLPEPLSRNAADATAPTGRNKKPMGAVSPPTTTSTATPESACSPRRPSITASPRRPTPPGEPSSTPPTPPGPSGSSTGRPSRRRYRPAPGSTSPTARRLQLNSRPNCLIRARQAPPCNPAVPRDREEELAEASLVRADHPASLDVQDIDMCFACAFGHGDLTR